MKEQLTETLGTHVVTIDDVQFDADAPNTIFFSTAAKGKTYRVGHTFSPLTDERYFKYSSEGLSAAKRIAKRQSIETDDFTPQENLWNDLCVGRVGYKERADWAEKVKLFEKIDTIKTLLFAELVESDDDVAESELLDDDDVQTIIRLDVYQSGALISTTHVLREASRAEVDEYLNARAGRPQKSALASSLKKTVEERLCELYDALIVDQNGYANRVPAWHKEKVVESYFGTVMSVGKSMPS